MFASKRPLKKFIKDEKAISPIIATLLLIAIAVAASVITYSWVMSMISSQSQQAQTQIRIDNVQWSNSTVTKKLDAVKITIRNTGSVAATVQAVSITVNQNTVTATLQPANRIVIQIGTASDYIFKAGQDDVGSSWTWAIQNSYLIRVTTTTGNYYESNYNSPITAPVALP